MARGGAAAAAREPERGRERERRGACGSEDGGGPGRADQVVDEGASKPSHARHAAAELCRLATAARRGGPRVWTRRRHERGEGGTVGAGRPGRLHWLGRLVGAGPPVNSPPFLFLNLFFPKSLNEIFEAFANFFRG